MTTLCGNEGHLDEMDELPAALVNMSWPTGRFKPMAACRECADTVIADYVLGDEDGQKHPVLIEPIVDTASGTNRQTEK